VLIVADPIPGISLTSISRTSRDLVVLRLVSGDVVVSSDASLEVSLEESFWTINGVIFAISSKSPNTYDNQTSG
jgi:hypothetical protein